jgi:probable F420-dependent oxidoreductase
VTGLSLFGDSMRLAEVGRLAARAEEAGFDSVWTGEYWHSGFQAASTIGAATSRVRVGAGVVQGYPRTPLMTALEALDTDDVCDGRFILGLGPQVQRYNERLHGIPYGKPVPRMRELVQALRLLWGIGEEGPISMTGEYYSFDLTGFRRPVPPVRASIPIYLAAVRAGMTRLAGECSDGIVGHPMSSLSDMAVYRTQVAEGAAKAGRAPSAVEHVQFVIASVSGDGARARRDAAHQIALYAGTRTYGYRLDEAGFSQSREAIRKAYLNRDTEAMVAAVSDEMIAAYAAAGTPAEVVAQVGQRASLCDLVVLAPPSYGLSGETVEGTTCALMDLFAT